MNYLEERLAKYHITEKDNTMKVAAEDPGHFVDFKFFTEQPVKDKDGKVTGTDIAINYLTPAGEVEYYNHGNSQTRRFSRIRKANPGDGPKYVQAKGTEMIPFSTPAIIEAYKKKKELKTLYVVEGEFKAFALSMMKQPTIGIGGIHNFKSADKTKMHPYIIDVIQTCKVQNVVLIFDKDCLEVEWEEGKDLSKRLNSFYVALNVFNELLKPYNVQLYFAHVSPKCDQKGIDDVLLDKYTDTATVLRELQSFTSGMPDREYIYTYQISGISSYKIKQIFGLSNVNDFCNMFADQVRNHDFVYGGILYYTTEKTDKDGNTVLTAVRSWAGQEKHYIRVGTEYYKTIVEKAPNGQTELNLVQWSADTIKNDYSNPKEFIKLIPKYDAFTNIPENDPTKYQQTIRSTKDGFTSVLYNRYCPVSHDPQPGEWRNINKLLHHIFDYKNLKGETFYEMILDYIQLTYLHPTQHLPILCLVSRERGTGKSTFLDLLSYIFKENMRILDSERIASKFNGSWVGKLIIGVDESFIDTDKPTVVNRLKMIATNNSIPLEKKGKDAGEVPNFAKLIMCSNDETNFLKIELEETRYWIIKVGSIPQGDLDPHIRERMQAEIPAFLYYLKNRTMYYGEKTRLWFDPADYATDALKKIQERTQPKIWKGLCEVITEQFAWQRTTRLFIDNKILILLLANHGYKQIDAGRIKAAMEDHGIERTVSARNFKYNTDTSTSFNANGLCYILHSDKFFSADQWDALINTDNESTENDSF